MSYFSQSEFELILSPAIYNKIFGNGSSEGWGGISPASGSLRFEMLSAQASSYVDAFLEPAGYSVPLDSPNDFVKRCAMYRCLVDVMALMNEPISDRIAEMVNRNESILHDIATGKIPVPNTTSSTSTGVGGSVWSAQTGSLGVQVSKSRLAGRFL